MRKGIVIAAAQLDAIRRAAAMIDDDMMQSNASADYMLTQLAIIERETKALRTIIENEYLTATELGEVSF